MKRYDVKTLVSENGDCKVWFNLVDMPIVAVNENEAIEFYKYLLHDQLFIDNCSDVDSLELVDDYLDNMICKAVEKEV